MKFISSKTIRLTSRGVKKIVPCIKTFTDEYHALQKLQGVPGVIKLLDVNIDTGTFYLDYHQHDLLDYLILNKPLLKNPHKRELYNRRMTETFTSLVNTVNTCHSNNIIHCDLKPDNIVLDDVKNPILIDFGHAINLESSFYRFLRGTDGYQAPEMKQGTFGYFTDVYSLGIILYTILMIRTPFILPDGNIDFNFNENEEIIPYKFVNLISDMTDPYYESRPTTACVLNELSIILQK